MKQSFLVDFFEVCLALLGVWFHGLLAWFPTSRTNFTVFVRVLEGLNKSEGFIDRPANWKIIYGNLTQVAFVINDEQTPESNATLFLQNTIVPGDFHGFICQQWNLHFTETTLFTGSIHPCKMREVAVCGTANNFAIDGTELIRAIAEGDDLGGADESEVQRVEEED